MLHGAYTEKRKNIFLKKPRSSREQIYSRADDLRRNYLSIAIILCYYNHHTPYFVVSESTPELYAVS